MNFRIILPIYKILVDTLIEIELNSYATLEWILYYLVTHKHCLTLHLLIYYFISSISVL